MEHPVIRMVAIDMDGTLLGQDGQVSARNLQAVRAAELAGIQVVIATGRRHGYAMRVLRALALNPASPVVSSNGTVTRTIDSTLIDRTVLPHATALWLCHHLAEFRNALVLTFDRTGPDGEDARGTLVVEQLDNLHNSIGKWMQANEPCIAHVSHLEDALRDPQAGPIQMMLCGTVDRMRRAEARLLEHPGIQPSGSSSRSASQPSPEATLDGQLDPDPLQLDPAALHRVTLHRTVYPDRDLSILDILPGGCSKGSALLALAARHGIPAGQTMAIGDNWNDLSMLEVAGRAVVMGNAPDALRFLARQNGWTIGPANDADGVAQALEAVTAAALAVAVTAAAAAAAEAVTAAADEATLAGAVLG